MAVGTYSTADQNLAIDRNIRRLAWDEFREGKTQYPGWCKVETDRSRKTIKEGVIATFPVMNDVDELEDYPEHKPEEVGYAEITMVKFGMASRLSREARLWDMRKVVNSIGPGLGRSGRQRLELVGAYPLNYATDATAYTVYDGQALLSDAHPMKSGGTQDNLGTGAGLTSTLLFSLIFMVELVQDDQGKDLDFTADTIIIYPTLEPNITEVLKSKEAPYVATNTYNPIQDRNLTVKYARKMSDTTRLFVIDRKNTPFRLIWAETPRVERDSSSGWSNDSQAWKWSMIVGAGAFEWKGGAGLTGVS